MESTLNIVEATGLQFHPLANIFPLMDADELKRLTEDIRTHGQREPIQIYEGKILDGRNRYRACLRIGVEPKTEEYTGNTPLDYVVSRNMLRRHLNESQRAWSALKITTLRRGNGQSASIEAYSQKEAAFLFKISRSAIQRAAQVANKGVPALKEAVSEGTISVAAALGIAALPPEKQNEVMALRTKREVLKAVRQLQRHPQDCACAECADKKLRTFPVTVLFTDAELKQFDKARRRHHCDDSREVFIHWLVTDFSDEKTLPPTKQEFKKIERDLKRAYYDSPAFANLPPERRSPNGEADTDPDHPDYDAKEAARARKLEREYDQKPRRERERLTRQMKRKDYKPYGVKI